MYLNTIQPAEGAFKKRKRIGRGTGSGHGKTSTKGHKGQKARSGGNVKPGFEGGQMPMQRRLPKRGFTPLSKTEYAIVKIDQLNCFESGAVVTMDSLVNAGLVDSLGCKVKILADGEIEKNITIYAHKFSLAAKQKILAAGGYAEELQS